MNVSLDPGLLEAIDREASRRKMTQSAFLSSAARAELRGEHGASPSGLVAPLFGRA